MKSSNITLAIKEVSELALIRVQSLNLPDDNDVFAQAVATAFRMLPLPLRIFEKKEDFRTLKVAITESLSGSSSTSQRNTVPIETSTERDLTDSVDPVSSQARDVGRGIAGARVPDRAKTDHSLAKAETPRTDDVGLLLEKPPQVPSDGPDRSTFLAERSRNMAAPEDKSIPEIVAEVTEEMATPQIRRFIQRRGLLIVAVIGAVVVAVFIAGILFNSFLSTTIKPPDTSVPKRVEPQSRVAVPERVEPPPVRAPEAISQGPQATPQGESLTGQHNARPKKPPKRNGQATDAPSDTKGKSFAPRSRDDL